MLRAASDRERRKRLDAELWGPPAITLEHLLQMINCPSIFINDPFSRSLKHLWLELSRVTHHLQYAPAQWPAPSALGDHSLCSAREWLSPKHLWEGRKTRLPWSITLYSEAARFLAAAWYQWKIIFKNSNPGAPGWMVFFKEAAFEVWLLWKRAKKMKARFDIKGWNAI